MTTFSTGGSAVTFTTSGSAVSFAVAPASNAFTTSAVLTPGAHASTHGAGGADPITTLGTVAVSALSGTATTLTVGTATMTLGTATTLQAGTATIGAGTATNLVLVTPTIGTATATGGTFTNATLVTPTIGTATMTGGTATTLTAAGEIHTGQSIFAAGSAAGPSLAFSGDTNTGIYSPGADQVGIATAGTARVYVASDGKVGVGTTGPAGPLEVRTAGAAQGENAFIISNPGTADYVYTTMHGYAAGNIQSSLMFQRTGTTTSGQFNIYTRDAGSLTERFSINGAGLITGTGSSLGAWTSYTPSWTASVTNPTIGNGSITGVYSQIGKSVIMSAQITIGSTTTVGSGVYGLSLPVTAKGTGQRVFMADGLAFDTSTGTNYPMRIQPNGTSAVYLAWLNAAFNYVTEASPVAWANGDVIAIQVRYEAA